MTGSNPRSPSPSTAAEPSTSPTPPAAASRFFCRAAIATETSSSKPVRTPRISSASVADDGLIFVLDRNANQVLVYTPVFRLTQTWRPFANSADRASAIAYGPDGYVYVLDGQDNRIGRFTESGHLVSEINARRQSANRRLGDQFAVANGSVFLMDGDGLTLHVFTSDGTPKFDFDLAPQLGREHRFVPALAVSPRRELLVLDSPDSRVLRYRINF
jgi:hypothetical protein